MLNSSPNKRLRKPKTISALADTATDPVAKLTFPETAEGEFGLSARLPAGEIRSEVERVLARFVPAHIVIDGNCNIVQVQGDAGRYLELAPGDSGLNLFKMLRPDLAKPMRATLRAAGRRQAPARVQGVTVEINDGQERLVIQVAPLHAKGTRSWFVVIFGAEPPFPSADPQADEVAPRNGGGRPGAELVRLRSEIADVRESLRIAILQQEHTNRELKSANAEVQCANEELQSINEELETSREELQSSNDQLLTVNEGLLKRTLELAALNTELTKLFASVNVAAIVIDTNLRIKCMTAAAETAFDLISGDVGRALRDLKLGDRCPNLEQRLLEVMKTGKAAECTLEDKGGRRSALRLRPYLGEEKEIEGVSMVMVDAA